MKTKLYVDVDFELGHLAYVKTDPDSFPRMVTGIIIREGTVLYELSFAEITTKHYGFELEKQPPDPIFPN